MTDDSEGASALAPELDCAASEVLGGRICAAAGLAAQSQCRLLELIGDFDAGNAVRWWDGVTSLAHWLSWACSMSPGTAREHVRVARALRRMPTIRQAFREGRLSYSKVREATRVVDLVDDAELCELALTATAAQLATTVSGYRTAAGTRLHQQRDRGLTWTTRDNGTVDVRLRLPTEEAALLLAALTTAKDQHGTPPSPGVKDRGTDGTGTTDDSGATEDTDTTPAYTLADAMLDVARTFLATAPEDRSGEDRSLVVVQVHADQLTTDQPTTDPAADDVPAGTSPTPTASTTTHRRPDPTCHVQGVGGIEPDTARKLACDTDLYAAVLDDQRNVLTLGRTHRLVSRTQRRALIIRDQARCQFTGCHQTRHLKAHHLLHWADGGPTDLDNLILLCQFHQARRTLRPPRSRPSPLPDAPPGPRHECGLRAAGTFIGAARLLGTSPAARAGSGTSGCRPRSARTWPARRSSAPADQPGRRLGPARCRRWPGRSPGCCA